MDFDSLPLLGTSNQRQISLVVRQLAHQSGLVIKRRFGFNGNVPSSGGSLP